MEYLQHKYDAEFAPPGYSNGSDILNGSSTSTICTLLSETKSGEGLTDVDCDSSYAPVETPLSTQLKKDSAEACDRNKDIVPKIIPPTAKLRDGFLKPRIKLPPVGSPAHHFIITQLMTDPLLDQEIKRMQAANKENILENGNKPNGVFCFLFCSKSSPSSNKRGEGISQRKANMFSMLVRGGDKQRRAGNTERVRI